MSLQRDTAGQPSVSYDPLSGKGNFTFFPGGGMHAESMQNVPECMQGLHEVPCVYMQFHELACSYMSFLSLSEQLTRISQCLFFLSAEI